MIVLLVLLSVACVFIECIEVAFILLAVAIVLLRVT